MIGIVIVTHGNLGDALVEAVQFITGPRPASVETVSIDVEGRMNGDRLRDEIASAIKVVNKGKGVLILTDMFGGSPSNISYSFLNEGRIEVLTGINLPVLIKALEVREDLSLLKAVDEIEKYGKKSIASASSVLKGQDRH